MAGHPNNLDYLPVMLWYPGSANPLPGIFGYRLIYAGDGVIGNKWSNYRAPPYRAGHHSIQRVIAGSGAIEVDGTWHALRPGMVVVVPGHRWLRRRGDAGLHLRFAGFVVEPASADFALGACPVPVVAEAADAAVLKAGLVAALALMRGPTPVTVARVVAGLVVAGALLGEHSTGPLPVPIPPAVQRACAFLDRSYRDTPSLAAVAAAAGRSANHLHQAFRAALGCTPATYAERLRLRDAQLLLADPGLPIAEVAQRCGYDDPFHFSRVVKRVYGSSPRALRQRLEGFVCLGRPQGP